mmetsp:Transcript_35402/g.101735  ORF Transcript_35402/g.101735 Transcript_35402/m.101735 type:complete len:226 (+) Transcript_35402:355-1032(+)
MDVLHGRVHSQLALDARGLHGSVDKEAIENVEEGEEHEGNVGDKQDLCDDTDHLQRLHSIHPTVSTRYAHEEGHQGGAQRPEVLLHGLDRLLGLLALKAAGRDRQEVGAHGLHEHARKHVEHRTQKQDYWREAVHGLAQGLHHRPQVLDQDAVAGNLQEAEDAEQPHRPEQREVHAVGDANELRETDQDHEDLQKVPAPVWPPEELPSKAGSPQEQLRKKEHGED